MGIIKTVKKTLTVFMLVVFLLNVLGFYGVFLGLKFSNSLQAMRAMDEDRYSLENSITFKVPLTVPYYTGNEDEYKRVDGEFEHNGEVYRMVKQKLFRDTLYIVCINDQKSKSINEAMSDYVKTFSDKPASAKQQNVKSLSFLKDYFSTSINIEQGLQGWNKKVVYPVYRNLYSEQSARQIFSPPKITLIR